jgi:hypothetical protein
MMQYKWLTILACAAATACSTTSKTTKPTVKQVNETPASLNADILTPGIPAYQATTVQYQRDGKKALTIQLKEPIVLGVADKVEKWGYFQFPHIERMAGDNIRVRWSMNDDAMEAYGKHKFGQVISKDGKTNWTATQDATPFTSIVLGNGERLSVHTPKPIRIDTIALPTPAGGPQASDTYSKSTYNYYRLKDLPESCNGIYFDRLSPNAKEWKLEKAGLNDPNAARNSLRGHIPIIWWGDIHLAKDNSLIAGIYPGFYIDDNNKALPKHNVFFYRSTDNGKNWNVQGRIFYVPDTANDAKGNTRMGFTEPTYEILADGTFICVSRTTDGIGNGPMYISRSSDMGKTWSKPVAFMASGVLPRLLQLQNGVTVMSSGRPGVQLRFSNDGKGQVWSNAFEMMPWIDYKDQVSCGYTGLLATGPDRFLIVYSDFRYVTDVGTVRKAIKVREVIVNPE